MSTSNLLGVVMLAAFAAGLFIYTARGMGLGEAIKAWAFAIAATAFVVTACALFAAK